MAKLENLQAEIDGGKTAELFLAHDHPGNAIKEDLTIRIFKGSIVGSYGSDYVYEDHKSPTTPSSPVSWSVIVADFGGLSDEWSTVDKSR